MAVLSTRALVVVFTLASAILALGGLSHEAEAQVYRGTITFQGLPSADLTVTVAPSGSASYRIDSFGSPVDAGALTANVTGSTVVGTIISNSFDPCQFQGTYDGTTAILTLDPSTCGLPGTATLTRT
jgi:hypothetical protein